MNAQATVEAITTARHVTAESAVHLIVTNVQTAQIFVICVLQQNVQIVVTAVLRQLAVQTLAKHVRNALHVQLFQNALWLQTVIAQQFQSVL